MDAYEDGLHLWVPRRVGSHEVIMERLHLSRPTFYRRLQRGFALVAERLDGLSEFAERIPVDD
jgi:hypothetical protein